MRIRTRPMNRCNARPMNGCSVRRMNGCNVRRMNGCNVRRMNGRARQTKPAFAGQAAQAAFVCVAGGFIPTAQELEHGE